MPTLPTPPLPSGGGGSFQPVGRAGYEESLLSGIFQTLERQLDSLIRVGLQSLVLWSLAVAIGGMVAVWGLKRAGVFGPTPRSQRRSTWALGLTLVIICWPALALPPTATAVTHRVREVISDASGRIGLTMPVGAAVLSPITAQMWTRHMLAPPPRRTYTSPNTDFINNTDFIDASALLDATNRAALLNALTPDAIWRQGESVRASILAARSPLPDWLLRFLIERGHRMLCDDLSMYSTILTNLAANPPPPKPSARPSDPPPPLLSLTAVNEFAGRAFFQDHAAPLVDSFMGYFEWLGRLIAFASFSLTTLLCAVFKPHPPGPPPA
jgi:hypothetical protein